MLAADRNALIGYPLLDYVAEQDRTAFLEHVQNCSRGRRETTCEATLIAKDGRAIAVQLHSVPVESSDAAAAFCKTAMTDITEHKRAEESLAREQANLRAVFDVVNVGMLVIGEDGAVKQVNDTLSRWVKKDLLASEGGQPGDFVGCVHALADPAGCGHGPQCASCPIRNAFTSVLRNGQSVHDVEVEAILSVGGSEAPIWLEVSADPLVLDGKRHAILAMNNITDRKRAEEELKAAKDSAEKAKVVAEQASRVKDHFLAVLSHELRTPLTPVVMGVSMLQERSDLEPEMRETLEMVRRNIEMEARLIDDLLDLRGLRAERSNCGSSAGIVQNHRAGGRGLQARHRGPQAALRRGHGAIRPLLG